MSVAVVLRFVQNPAMIHNKQRTASKTEANIPPTYSKILLRISDPEIIVFLPLNLQTGHILYTEQKGKKILLLISVYSVVIMLYVFQIMFNKYYI